MKGGTQGKELIRPKLEDIVRFFTFVKRNKQTGCWHWMGARDKYGYGKFRLGRHMEKAHRVSYAIFHGRVEAKIDVHHICYNTFCVNPDHSQALSRADNVADGNKNRNGNVVPF